MTKDKSLLRAHTDNTGMITMKQVHDSRPNVNVYDMRLKHNVCCETAEFINWIGMDYQILSLRGMGQDFCFIVIFIFQIADKRPYFNPLVMTVIFIIFVPRSA